MFHLLFLSSHLSSDLQEKISVLLVLSQTPTVFLVAYKTHFGRLKILTLAFFWVAYKRHLKQDQKGFQTLSASKELKEQREVFE